MKAAVKSLFPDTSLWLGSRRGFWSEYLLSGEYELQQLPNHVANDKIAIDIGANMGVYTYHLSRLSRRVIAFEPVPALANHLRRLGIKKTSVEEVALSDHNGHSTLRISEKGAGVASLEALPVPGEMLTAQIEVPVRRLDEYALRGVGFIKIDVEGHEEAVLAGAIKTIERERPVLLVEVEERHNPGGLPRITAKLGARGYEGFFFEEGQKKKLAEFNLARHQRPSSALHTFKNRRKLNYINNFLFLPA